MSLDTHRDNIECHLVDKTKLKITCLNYLLYCIVLYCIVLYCIVLYCIVLYFAYLGK